MSSRGYNNDTKFERVAMSVDYLDTKIVVRRVRAGAEPYTWEIYGSNTAAPRYVSLDRFRSMEAAYVAARARLNEFLPVKGAKRKRPTDQTPIKEDHNEQSDEYPSIGVLPEPLA